MSVEGKSDSFLELDRNEETLLRCLELLTGGCVTKHRIAFIRILSLSKENLKKLINWEGKNVTEKANLEELHTILSEKLSSDEIYELRDCFCPKRLFVCLPPEKYTHKILLYSLNFLQYSWFKETMSRLYSCEFLDILMKGQLQDWMRPNFFKKIDVPTLEESDDVGVLLS